MIPMLTLLRERIAIIHMKTWDEEPHWVEALVWHHKGDDCQSSGKAAAMNHGVYASRNASDNGDPLASFRANSNQRIP
jgi:hypothetical protein